MIKSSRRVAVIRSSTAAFIVVAMAMPVGLAQETMGGQRPLPVTAHVGPLTEQERVLHALNRLTFGPRPGDEAAVAKMGLERWFALQLHPERIDDAALEQRLTMFPAMQLSTVELLQRFPDPQKLRQMSRQEMSFPADPVERAIYADSEAAYRAKKKKDAEATAASGQMETQIPAGSDKQGDAGALSANSRKDERGDVDALLALPAEERLGRLVAMTPDEMLEFRAALKPKQLPELMQGLTPAQMEAVAAMQAPARVVAAEALGSRLMRDLYSERQLQAVMTDFWLNHFNVYLRKNQIEPYYLPAYERETILPNALGNFEHLLVATAQSPAMLLYLDNWQSIGPDSPAARRVKQVQAARPNGKIAQALPQGINENYARELMELHTLGVGGGYTQQDVIAVAKCFTGWTIAKPYAGAAKPAGRFGGAQREMNGDAQPGTFVFEPNRHEGGDKVVLGHTIHEGGVDEGLEVLHLLATSPATAKFVATKLAVRFVSDDPPPALVSAMAATFLKTGGDIKAVLSTMFHAPEFSAPQVYQAKVKTPLEFVVSAVRASDAEVRTPLPLVQAMDRLGMPIYGMQTPNGYSWKAEDWVSSNALVGRLNFALVLAGDRMPGVRPDWMGQTGKDGQPVTDPEAVEARLEKKVLGQAASARTRATVLAQAGDGTAIANAEQRFRAQKGSGDAEEMEPSGEQGAAMLQRPAPGKRGKGGAALEPGPATPVQTMAGLLLGSPEFQRR